MSSEGIESALRKVKGLPAPVQGWRVEIGEDSGGNEAVWVWVTLRDEDLVRDTRTRIRELVRDAVHRSLGKQEPWVYVRFRGASETEE
jgi:hypothetical protein